MAIELAVCTPAKEEPCCSLRRSRRFSPFLADPVETARSLFFLTATISA